MITQNDCILVVEDEFIIAEFYVDLLEEMGCSICGVAATAQEAIALAREHRPSLVLMDVRLKGAEDVITASVAIRRDVGSKIVFVTGSKEPANLQRIADQHPTAVLFKPLKGPELQAAVAAAMAS